MRFKFISTNHPLYEKTLGLRWEALHKPLGLPPGSEVFPDEGEGIHMVAMDKKKLVGALIFRPEGETRGTVYHMAVSDEYKGKSFGRKMWQTLEEFLFKQGYVEVSLWTDHDRIYFFETLGFIPDGEVIHEDERNQMRMSKTLSSNCTIR